MKIGREILEFSTFWKKNRSWSYQHKKIQLFCSNIKMKKRFKTSQAISFSDWKPEIPLSMFSKLALTDMRIHFFEIFLRQNILTRKNTAFLFLHQNGETAQNLPSNWFSDWKPELSLYMFSKSALTDMWIHFFEIFLRQKVSARKNIAFLFLHQNGKTAQNLPSN